MSEQIDLGTLRRFGYAPGSYMCKCAVCLREHVAAKKAWRCKQCAEEAVALSAKGRSEATR